MNELIFLLQIGTLLGFTFGAARLGKEALLTWVAVLALLANLFVLKQVTLFGLEVTAADPYAIGSLLGLNMLQEYFGKEEAAKATLTCFLIMFAFAILSQLHLHLTPNGFDSSDNAFHALLNPAPRLFIASLSVFFVVQQFDIRFFHILKKKLPAFSFAARAFIALIISQGLDTILFSFAGLYGIVGSVIEIMVFSFAIKMIVITLSAGVLKGLKA